MTDAILTPCVCSAPFDPQIALDNIELLQRCDLADDANPADPAEWKSDDAFNRYLALRSALDGDMSGLSTVPHHCWARCNVLPASDRLVIETASRDEAEKADFLICCRAGDPVYFDDDDRGACCMCGCEVFFRPSAPKTPPRICIPCAIAYSTASRQ